MKSFAFVLLLSTPYLPAQTAQPPAANTTRYVVILSGNKAGFQTTTANPDGTLQVHYEFNDRGRGPNADETITLNQNGVPVRLIAKGVDYMKAAVEETFSIENGTAQWKNRAESGEKQVSAGEFYSSVSGTPEDFHLAALAALKSPDHKLRLIPEGTFTIEKKTDLKLDVAGQNHTATLYWISGLGFTPSPVWLIDDGELMAFVSSWQSQVPEGFESAIPAMTAAQDKFSDQRAGDLAHTLGRRPGKPLAFVHARLFDSETAQSLPNRTVLIMGNKITAVGPDGKVMLPKDAEVIDASGKTLMPGLWDMHVHVSPDDGLLHIAAGVTSVRDLANDTEFLMKTRDRYDRGEEIGPRVVMAGFIDGRGPYQGPTKVFADSVEEAQKDVDNYAKLGYVQIKVYSSLKPELVPEIAKMAHSRGMRLSGHVPAGMNAEQFVKAGADEIQHMNFILLNFMPQVKDTRTPARFTEVAAHAADLDLNSPPVKSFIQLLKEHKTVVDPTLSIFESMLTSRPGVIPAGWADVAERMPADVRRGYLYGGIAVPEGMDQKYRDSFRQMERMTKALYDAGIPIVAGTDSLAGFSLHRELEIYNEAGIPAPKVLQLATLGAAHIMKRDSQLGSIAPGKLADVILVPGDPATHISDIKRVQTVVEDGVVYQVADLDRAIGVKPAN
ncbi:MAG TPA: amidohydrolase family protein [Candidatus Limnocylindrales bacterium]|nr:amidohydrolase family protein [Candidatus Limnocylindrales bacterium]